MSFTVVIPARYQSSRLPAKPLADIGGKPMIAWVYEKALHSGASNIIIAKDHSDIANVAYDFGATVCMTDTHHNSGTERIAQVIEQLTIKDTEIIVNLQGDEPLIPSNIIAQVANNLATSNCSMATLAAPINDVAQLFDPNTVKLVTDINDHALYFSRSPIAWDRDSFSSMMQEDLGVTSYDHGSLIGYDLSAMMRHLGIYAYRAGFINTYLNLPVSPLEKLESLEQLRVLYHGYKIHVAQALEVPATGVDTIQDLERVRAIIALQN